MSMTIAPGSTSVSRPIKVVDDSGLPVEGLTAATFPALRYHKVGAATVLNVTISDLASLSSSFTQGGIKEIGDGEYRFDLPNAMISTVATVALLGDESGKHVIFPIIEVKYADISPSALSTALAAAGTSITVVSPVDQEAGTIIVKRTDDFNTTTGQQISFTAEGFPTFPSDGVKLRASRNGSSTLIFSEVSCTIADAGGGDQTVTCDLTVAQVVLLRFGSLDDFRFECTYGDGSKRTVWFGKFDVQRVGS